MLSSLPPDSADAAVLAAGALPAAEGEPQTLLQANGWRGFPSLSETALRNLCKLMGWAAAAGFNLFELIECMARASLPKISDDDILQIMHKRLTPQSRVDEGFWASAEVVDCFDQQDKVIISKFSERIIAIDKKSPTYKSLKSFTKKVHVARTAGLPKKEFNERAKHAKRMEGRRRTFNPVAAPLTTVENGEAFLPSPDCV